MTASPSGPRPAKRPPEVIEDAVRPACAMLRCSFHYPEGITPVVRAPEILGNAFLVAADLIATCAHLLDLVHDGSESYILRFRSSTTSTDGTPCWDVADTKTNLNIGVAVYTLSTENLSPGDRVYNLRSSGNSSLGDKKLVSGGYLRWLSQQVERRVHLKFYSRPVEVVVNIPGTSVYMHSVEDCASAQRDVAEAESERFARLSTESDLQTLSPAAFCAREHDCAIIRLGDQILWEITPIPLGTGDGYKERVFMYGYPASRKGLLCQNGTVERSHFYDEQPGQPMLSRRLDLHFPSFTLGSDPRGYSGSVIVAEDGTCIGIQCAMHPTSSGSSTQFGRLLATPAIYLQRLVPLQLEIEYRSHVYKHALNALHDKRNLGKLNVITLTHPTFRGRMRTLAHVVEAARFLGQPELQVDLLRTCNSAQVRFGEALDRNAREEQDAELGTIAMMIERADLILICPGQPVDDPRSISAASQQFSRWIKHCEKRVEAGLAVVMWCAITTNMLVDPELDKYALDVSEIFPINSFVKSDPPGELDAWTRVVYRIQLLMEDPDRSN